MTITSGIPLVTGNVAHFEFVRAAGHALTSPTKWNHGGGLRSPSCLDKACAHVGELLEIWLRGDPAGNAPNVPGPRARGRGHRHRDPLDQRPRHARMQRRYSTVSGDEQRAGLATVIDIANGRERTAA